MCDFIGEDLSCRTSNYDIGEESKKMREVVGLCQHEIQPFPRSKVALLLLLIYHGDSLYQTCGSVRDYRIEQKSNDRCAAKDVEV